MYFKYTLEHMDLNFIHISDCNRAQEQSETCIEKKILKGLGNCQDNFRDNF